MKSQCWGREAKPCLSECSGCCSLLKCQVLLRNNTPPSLSFALLPLAPCLPPPLHPPSKPDSSQRWSRGWGMNPQLGFASRANCSVSAAFRIQYLFIFLFFSPHLPCGHWGGNSECDEMKPFLFSCSHFPATVTLPLLIPSISSPVSLDFPMMCLRALIGPKYHKHHQTHLFGKRQLHPTNYMAHFYLEFLP